MGTAVDRHGERNVICSEVESVVVGTTDQSFFPGDIGAVGMKALPFSFLSIPAEGMMAEVQCSEETNIMVTVEDDSPLGTLYMSA